MGKVLNSVALVVILLVAGCHQEPQGKSELELRQEIANDDIEIMRAQHRLDTANAKVLTAMQNEMTSDVDRLAQLRSAGKVSEARWQTVLSTRSEGNQILDRLKAAQEEPRRTGRINEEIRQMNAFNSLTKELRDYIKDAEAKP